MINPISNQQPAIYNLQFDMESLYA